MMTRILYNFTQIAVIVLVGFAYSQCLFEFAGIA